MSNVSNHIISYHVGSGKKIKIDQSFFPEAGLSENPGRVLAGKIENIASVNRPRVCLLLSSHHIPPYSRCVCVIISPGVIIPYSRTSRGCLFGHTSQRAAQQYCCCLNCVNHNAESMCIIIRLCIYSYSRIYIYIYEVSRDILRIYMYILLSTTINTRRRAPQKVVGARKKKIIAV